MAPQSDYWEMRGLIKVIKKCNIIVDRSGRKTNILRHLSIEIYAFERSSLCKKHNTSEIKSRLMHKSCMHSTKAEKKISIGDRTGRNLRDHS